MISEEAFRAYYDNTISLQVSALGKKLWWSKVMKRAAITVVAVANILCIRMVILTPNESTGGMAIAVALFSTLAYYGLTYQSSTRLDDDFKDTIIRGIVSFLNPDFVYEPDKYIAESVFDSSDIFYKEGGNYEGSDYIEGQVDGNDFAMAWVDLTAPGDVLARKFKGIFFMTGFNKSFKGETFILPRVKADIVEKGEDKLHIDRPPQIKLEDPEFNKIFAAFSDDPIEGRYIISPLFMEKTMELKSKLPGDVYISFVDTSMFVALQTNEKIFEAQWAMKKYDNMLELFRYMNAALGIVGEFELNKKIWG